MRIGVSVRNFTDRRIGNLSYIIISFYTMIYKRIFVVIIR